MGKRGGGGRRYNPGGTARVTAARGRDAVAKAAAERTRTDAARNRRESLLRRRDELRLRVEAHDAALRELAVQIEVLEAQKSTLESKIVRRVTKKTVKMAKAGRPFRSDDQRKYISTLKESGSLAEVSRMIEALRAQESRKTREERRELETIER